MKLVKKCINVHIIQTSFMYILKISATTYILKLVLNNCNNHSLIIQECQIISTEMMEPKMCKIFLTF